MSSTPSGRICLRDGAIAAAALLTAIAWALSGGKDMNPDQTNYHFYVAHALLQDRLGQDFMPAGGASYFNPLAYVPFYWMVTHQWHSVLVGSLLAALHAGNVVVAYLIARKACLASGREHWHISVLAAVLAFLSPTFLAEVGTTFADVSTSVLVLSGVLLALDAGQEPARRWNRAFLAGLLVGAAGGLKLSNAIYGPPLVLMALFLPLAARARAKAAAGMIVGGACGFALMHGYWSWRLWSEFGNPFFPLFNAFFQSPYYPAISHRHERFLPDSFLEALLMPFNMASPRAWIYIDTSSPDLRFAAAFVALLAAGAATFWRSRGAHEGRKAQVQPTQDRLGALAAFFVVSFALWLWTSGNGRYGVALSVLAGPALAVAACAATRAQFARSILAVIALLQAFHFATSGDRHWDVAAWSRSWYEPSVPARLAREPYLYLVIGNSSLSYVVPYLDQRSAFVNLLGITSIDLDGPGGQRVRELMRRYEGRIRVLARAPSLEFTDKPMTHLPGNWLAGTNSHLSRIDFRVDEQDCQIVSTVLGREHGVGLEWKDAWRAQLLTCLLEPRKGDYGAERVERERVRRVFSAVLHWCPKLLKPSYSVVEKSTRGWFSVHPDTDSFLVIEEDTVQLVQLRTSLNLALGTLADWERGPAPPDCASLPRKLRKTLNFH